MTVRRAVVVRRNLLVAVAFAGMAGCESGRTPASDDAAVDSSSEAGAISPHAKLVDSAITPAVAGSDGWMYTQSVGADLDADGVAERVVLTARAEVMNGRPLWDDGQPWQVYVEEPDGERSYLYARYVQLGMVTMRIGLAEGGDPATVVLLEHLPDRLALYEIVYRGPGQAETVQHFERSLDPTGEVASPRLP